MYLEINTVVSNWQWVPCVQISPTVKNRFQRSKDFGISVNHSFDNFTIDFPRAFIRRYTYIIMMYKPSWHCDLKVVGFENNRTSFMAQVRTSWTQKYYNKQQSHINSPKFY